MYMYIQYSMYIYVLIVLWLLAFQSQQYIKGTTLVLPFLVQCDTV
jgi:hypothetical protein